MKKEKARKEKKSEKRKKRMLRAKIWGKIEVN